MLALRYRFLFSHIVNRLALVVPFLVVFGSVSLEAQQRDSGTVNITV
jgi:hypothetical protein